MAASDCLRPGAVSGQRFETAATRDQIVKVRFGEAHSSPALIHLAKIDNLLLMRKRRRPQEHGINHAKDRGRRAQAEPERDNGDSGEARPIEHRPKCQFQIAHRAILVAQIIYVKLALQPVPLFGCTTPVRSASQILLTCHITRHSYYRSDVINGILKFVE
jgi:hypothetical protein